MLVVVSVSAVGHSLPPTARLYGMNWVYRKRDVRELEYWRWTDVARSARKFGVNIKRGW
jgi:hypothetical protein